MFKTLISFSFITILILLFTGCLKQKQDPLNNRYSISSTSFFDSNEFDDLDKAIDEIANQLLINITANNHKNYKIAMTAFVKLDDFSKTNSFGRMLSESLINELHSRRFKVLDFRTREVITVNEDGEFVMTRDVNEIRDEIPAAYTLVGTYSVLDDKRIVINTRIIDIFSSNVISTSRVLYTYGDCSKYDLCTKSQMKRIPKQLNIMEQ